MKYTRILLAWMAIFILSLAQGPHGFKNDVRVFQSVNKEKRITPGSIEKAFKDAGFVIGANNNMNHPFRRDFGKTHMDVYNLMVVYRKDTVYELAKDYPEIGLFTPISMSIYTRKGSDTISVATLRPEVMADLMGVPRTHPAIKRLGDAIEKALHKAMPKGKFIELPYVSKRAERDVITRYTFVLDGDDIEEAKDAFEEEFEEAMTPHGFVMASFTDLGYELEEKNLDWYDFYDVYSICKIPVIYEVSKRYPEAGAFAPCSAYIYKKKDEETVHMAFPNVYKWIASLNITDQASIDVLTDAQERFERVLEGLKKKYAIKPTPRNEVRSDGIK
jgi:uncharacterized protein (DUF302 family)